MYTVKSEKRTLAGLLALMTAICLCFSCLSLAHAEDAAFALVDNPTPNGYLNLRKEPDKSSQSLGRYYNGVEVEVLEKGDEWSHVRVGEKAPGSASGYMLNEYLDFNTKNSDVQKHVYRGLTISAGPQDLKARPSTKAAAVDKVEPGTMVDIMGVITNWYHVSIDGKVGYLNAQGLDDRVDVVDPSSATHALVNNDSQYSRLRLRLEPNKGSKVLGSYRNGVEVEILSYREPFSMVKIGDRIGFMMNAFLAFNASQDDVLSNIKIATVHPLRKGGTVALYNRPTRVGQVVGVYAEGTHMEMLGEAGNWQHVRIGSVYGFLPLFNVVETEAISIPYEGVAASGYGVVILKKASDSLKMYAFPSETTAQTLKNIPGGSTVQLVYDMGDWAQVRYNGLDGFVRTEALNVYPMDALQVKTKDTFAKGAYTVGKEIAKPGLYTFELAKGEKGSVEVTPEGAKESHSYDAQGEAAFAMYLPEGAKVVVKGDAELEVMPAKGEMMDEFTGTGRFLVGRDVVDGVFVISLAPDAAEGYYAISNLNTDAGLQDEIQRVEVLPGVTYMYDLERGQFIELQNCAVKSNG